MAIGTARLDPPEIRIVELGDGVWAQKVERRTPLPPRLDTLLQGIHVTQRLPVRVHGARFACLEDEHDKQRWVSGVYAGLDLRLNVCIFCGGVEVRDVSFDILVDRAPDGREVVLTPHGMARRKDDVLGFYSGRRPAGRVYY